MTEETVKIIQAIMFGLSAVLPIVGFGRLLWRASSALSEANKLIESRGHTAATHDDFQAEMSDISAKPRAVRNALIWDICLVGIGLALGAIASIWSLHN